jgi:hypothetical protein
VSEGLPRGGHAAGTTGHGESASDTARGGLGEPAGWPVRTRIRFAGHEVTALASPAHAGYVIGCLLEEGDGDELRWLVAAIGPARVAEWVETHGARRLSRRSRAFWLRVLGLPPTGPAAVARELWPLA